MRDAGNESVTSPPSGTRRLPLVPACPWSCGHVSGRQRRRRRPGHCDPGGCPRRRHPDDRRWCGPGRTLHRGSALVGTGASGSGSGAGGATANADDPAAGTRSLTGAGGGGASALSLGGTYVRAGGGGGGGYDGPGDTEVGLGGETPALVFGDGLPVVEFGPTGGGGGGSCYLVGSKALSGIASDGSGGAGATADPAPPSIWAVNMMTDAELPAPIDGTDGWVRLTMPDAAPAPAPGLGVWGLVSLSSLLLGLAGWRGRARGSNRSGQRWRG